MKIKHYFYSILCCMTLHYTIVASEGPIEAETQKISESIIEARNTQTDANKRIEQAKEEQTAATTDEEKTKAELSEQEASRDLYTAQIQEQTGLLDLANQKNDTQAEQDAEKAINVAESNQKEAQAIITKLTQQLTQEFVSTQEIFQIKDITSDSQLGGYAQNLQAGTFDDNLSQKIYYLRDLRTKVQNMFLDKSIEGELGTKKTTEEKLGFLDNKRMILNKVLDVYRSELNNFDAWSKSHKVTDVMQEYKESLENAINSISQKKVLLDMHSASLELQNVSLFSRIISAVKDWFDSTFDFYKTPWYKRSVDYEISKLSDINQQIDQLKFVYRIYDIASDISSLETQFQNYKAGKSPLNINEFNDTITTLENDLNTLKASDIQNAHNAVNAFNALYEESLQPMMGDIYAKLRRYKDPEFATLFDQLADYYGSDSIFGGLPYRPEQAYQALFTPEVIASLNKKPGLNLTSAMFDPLTFNPDTISPELIDKAYEERTLYKETTTTWKAVRNAAFLLRNPVDKATYDTFLKDYKTLLSQGVKDPYKGRSALDTMNLNNQGALSKLQITEATKNQITPLLNNLYTTIQTKSEFDDVARVLPTFDIDNLKGRIQTLQQNVADFESSQQQQILGGS